MFVEILATLVACHLIGDYILQTQYIAENKATDRYLLVVHSFLYAVPFVALFGFELNSALFLFVSHIIIDYCKATAKLFSITVDQILHYVCALIYFAILVYSL